MKVAEEIIIIAASKVGLSDTIGPIQIAEHERL
jgi:hypothetical protein